MVHYDQKLIAVASASLQKHHKIILGCDSDL